MKPEDIDRALAELQPSNADSGPAAAPRNAFAPLGRATAGATAEELLRAVLGRAPEPTEVEAAREQARADRLVAHRKRVIAKRETLAPRIDPRLLAKLQARHSPCALLLGPTGCGKTSAAQWLRVGLPGEWASARYMGACERHHRLGEGTPPAFDRACSASVLYLDDLGTEDARDIGVLQHVLERRYAGNLATCVTTGLTRDMLVERYGAATMRRLAEQHVLKADGNEWPILFVDLTGGAQ
jgi:hypothetical protein